MDADLKTRTLDILDAGPFIGYSPERLEREGASGAITVRSGHPMVLPDAPLAIDALKNFDADIRYRATKVRADSFPLSNIALTLGLDCSRLTPPPFPFDVSYWHPPPATIS